MRGQVLALVLFLLVGLCNTLNLDVVPVYQGAVFPGKQPINLKSPKCFQNTTAHLENANEKGATLVFLSQNPTSFSCNDVFVSVTQKQWKLSLVMTRGKHTYDLTWNSAEEWEIVKKIGVSIFLIQKKFKELYEVYQLYESWVKNDPMVIKKLLEQQLDFKFANRKQDYVMLDESYIQDGDTLAITKFNREEAGIMMGVNSRTGHSAIFLRDPDTQVLYIIEATPDFGGFHKTEYKEWMKLHLDGTRCSPDQCGAVHMPLRKDLAVAFKNYTRKAWEFFTKMEGQPYIYHSNFFSALDSSEHCLPSPMDCDMAIAILSVLDRVYPDTFRDYFMEGFEHRLGKRFENFLQLVEFADSINKTLPQIWSIPEQDNWLYEGRVCLQCTSLVIRMLKEGHIFDFAMKKPLGYSDDKINAAEFQPRDMYQVQLWETDPSRKPFGCFDGFADDKGYCQILGRFVIELPTYSTIPPYEHMNERCYADIHFPAKC